ncbi:cytochrome P450 2C7-like [Haliotis rubra]|uniref:cytochrome P450 2C7-like n=1 Tax=Haliotis rubra TaxID=36100 RepID=UPI001EE54E6F|nr:cytochrome P450 2C7-like [Haliotis rubra]
MITLEWFLGAVVALLIFYLYNINQKYRKMPPGPRPLPLVGNFLEVKHETLLFDLTKLGERYDGIFTIHLLRTPTVVLDAADIIRDLVTSTAFSDVFSGRRKSYLGTYILSDDISLQCLNTNEIYMKKLAFVGLKQNGAAINDIAQLVNVELVKLIQRFRETRGVPCDPLQDINQYVSNLMLMSICGQRFDSGHKALETCHHLTTEVDLLFNYRNMILMDNIPFITSVSSGLKRSCQRLENCIQYFMDTLESIRRETNCGLAGNLYTLLVSEYEDGNLSKDNIKGVVLDCLFAGILSPKPTLYAALLAMVHFPKVQRKIQEEIQRVVRKDRLPGLEDMDKMPYTKAVEMEIYRYFTPIGLPVPRITTEDCSYKQYFIPKGTTVVYNIWRVHHEETFWEKPFTFDPNRFLDENGQLLPPDDEKRQRLIPFGTGKRSCPGQKLARVGIGLALSSILQQFNLTKDPSQVLPSSDPRTYKIKTVLTPPAYQIQFQARCRTEQRY